MKSSTRSPTGAGDVRHDAVPFTDTDAYLYNEGNHFHLYQKLGAHALRHQGEDGVRFAVWAPNAERVNLIGDFNGWDRASHALRPLGDTGVWHGFVPGLPPGTLYKYHVRSRHNGYRADKADPVGFQHEVPPRTASRVAALDYDWNDATWMQNRGQRNALDAPMSVYEMHFGSWRHVPEEGNRSLTYREAAPLLSEHLRDHGFTHVEFLPLTEHPFMGSWGYQATGYFAPTSRYGNPQDLMFLVDHLHQNGIGVILDWVPSHFPNDLHGLGYFDGTHLYEHADPRKGFHPDWKSHIFNYGRHEVRSFLISSALFWLDKYHVDGIRVDAVASMLYLDYSRKAGEWVPNEYGGRENLEAIGFLRRLNEAIYQAHPTAQSIAEESTAWPMVSRPTYVGGLGFGLKWDMGWMHDTLRYLAHEPVHRRYHHNEITFRMVYAFNENFMLPLSHDEVVHGKGSLLHKMPGDDWQRFANLRLLYAYMHAQPGKKLLFMGDEFAQRGEWNHDRSLDWHLTREPAHQGIQRVLARLNQLHRHEPALHELDANPQGFEWVDANDADQSVLSLLRNARTRDDVVLAILNFTPVPRPGYRVGVPWPGNWQLLVNTDDAEYGGSGAGHRGDVHAQPTPWQGRPYSLELDLPPLGALFLKSEGPPT